MGTELLIDPVLAALRDSLKRRGYSKSGSTFRLRNPDTISIVSLQSSNSSSSSLVKVTVNLGVHIPALQDPQRTEKNRSISSCHWRQRIGSLMPEKNDVWWSIQTPEEASSVATAITRAVEQFGLPAVEQVSTVAALKQLWESGHGPGLTEVERVQCLHGLAQAVAS